MTRNIELLNRIKDAIRADPAQFTMGVWARFPVGQTACGTPACIGGFAVALSGGTLVYDVLPARVVVQMDTGTRDVVEVASQLLGLPYSYEEGLVPSLFFESEWSAKNRATYNWFKHSPSYDADELRKRMQACVEAACAEIDLWIAGREDESRKTRSETRAWMYKSRRNDAGIASRCEGTKICQI